MDRSTTQTPNALISEHADMARRIALKIARRTPAWVSADDLISAAITDTEAMLPKKHLIAQGFPPSSAPVPGLNRHVSILNFHGAKADAVQLNHSLNRVIALDETGGTDRSDLKYRTEAWKWILAGGAIYDHLDFSFTTDHPDGSAVPLPSGTPGGGGPELRSASMILRPAAATCGK